MDSGYFSAFAALAGSAIGGLTSLAASWLNHRVEFRSEQVAHEHATATVSDLVNLYALVSRMRVLSSTAVVEAADRVVRRIIEQYRAPSKTLLDAEEVLDNDALIPLRDFSSACREELASGGGRDNPSWRKRAARAASSSRHTVRQEPSEPG